MPNTNVISIDDNDTLCNYDPDGTDFAVGVPTRPITNLTKNIITYIAGFVVRKVIRSLKCMTCFDKLLSSDDVDVPVFHCESSFDLIDLRDRGGLIRPSNCVIQLCKKTEDVIRGLDEKQLCSRSLEHRIRLSVLNESSDIFPDDHESGLNSHSLQLTKSIINTYIEVRLHHRASLFTDALQGKKIRSKLTKTILFSNQ